MVELQIFTVNLIFPGYGQAFTIVCFFRYQLYISSELAQRKMDLRCTNSIYPKKRSDASLPRQELFFVQKPFAGLAMSFSQGSIVIRRRIGWSSHFPICEQTLSPEERANMNYRLSSIVWGKTYPSWPSSRGLYD